MPSRLALVATRLPLRGVGTTISELPGVVGMASELVTGCVGGSALATVRAARLARLGVACESLPGRVALLRGAASATVTGLSGCWFCADAGRGRSASISTMPSGNAAPERQCCLNERREECARRRDGRRPVRLMRDTDKTNGE